MKLFARIGFHCLPHCLTLASHCPHVALTLHFIAYPIPLPFIDVHIALTWPAIGLFHCFGQCGRGTVYVVIEGDDCSQLASNSGP